MEIKRGLRTVYVKMICDKCHRGEMQRESNDVLFTDPLKYRHYCPVCGNRETYTTSYPSIRYEYTDESNISHVIHPSNKRGVVEDFSYRED